VKFCTYQLNWTATRVRRQEQADRWTHLNLLAYTLVRLARPVVADQQAPWECPLKAGKLIPYAPFQRCCHTSHHGQTHRNPVADALVDQNTPKRVLRLAILPSKSQRKPLFHAQIYHVWYSSESPIAISW
jgi:hypothetical protein